MEIKKQGILITIGNSQYKDSSVQANLLYEILQMLKKMFRKLDSIEKHTSKLRGHEG